MSDDSVETYDHELSTIEHYRAFPAMRPYIGNSYACSAHGSVLLLGESNYFPVNSTIHKDPCGWYAATQAMLTTEEISWLHNRELIKRDWDAPGHKMYRELNACIATVLKIPASPKVMSHVAFMNAFQRPAEKGKSLCGCCKPKDIAVSLDVICGVIEKIRPNTVIFASKCAFERFGNNAEKRCGVRCQFVSHPTDPFHWSVPNYAHGKDKFLQILSSAFDVKC